MSERMYHATTISNARSIMRSKRFCCGDKGLFGGGIYLAFSIEAAFLKSKYVHPTALIICSVNRGRIGTFKYAQNDWNLYEVNRRGYDSVQMLEMRTGPEACVYESWRVTPFLLAYIDGGYVYIEDSEGRMLCSNKI